MLVLLFMLIVFCFAVYLAIEAMKAGMCERKWFVAGMCLGPIVWPMFNVKKQMHLRRLQSQGAVCIRA